MNNIHSTVQRDMHVSVHKMDCDDYNNYKCYIYNFTFSLSKYCNTLLLYTENYLIILGFVYRIIHVVYRSFIDMIIGIHLWLYFYI